MYDKSVKLQLEVKGAMGAHGEGERSQSGLLRNCESVHDPLTADVRASDAEHPYRYPVLNISQLASMYGGIRIPVYLDQHTLGMADELSTITISKNSSLVSIKSAVGYFDQSRDAKGTPAMNENLTRITMASDWLMNLNSQGYMQPREL